MSPAFKGERVMTDIVERLRRPDILLYQYAASVADDGAFLCEAADEIERLRGVLQTFACKCEGDWCENLRFNDDKAKCEHYIARAALEEKE